MAKVTETSIDELIPDNENFNKGTEFGDSLMEKSIREFGLGRSIVLDKNNRIIAGNKTTGKAGELGFEKVVVVETDGKTLVAVKRNDIDLDTKQGREFALADNATGKANLAWDEEALQACSQEHNIALINWGVHLKEAQETYQEVEASSERDSEEDFEDEFDKYSDSNCEMPIVPNFFESHQCFVIPCHNTIDEGFIRDLFGLNEIYRSDSGDGKERKTNVISVEKLRSLVK